MPARHAADTAAAHISEKEFQQTVMAVFTAAGWHTYHNPDSRQSSVGWPDLQLLKPASRAGPTGLRRTENRPRQTETTWQDWIPDLPKPSILLIAPLLEIIIFGAWTHNYCCGPSSIEPHHGLYSRWISIVFAADPFSNALTAIILFFANYEVFYMIFTKKRHMTEKREAVAAAVGAEDIIDCRALPNPAGQSAAAPEFRIVRVGRNDQRPLGYFIHYPFLPRPP